jgi:hypothetical protein
LDGAQGQRAPAAVTQVIGAPKSLALWRWISQEIQAPVAGNSWIIR